MKPEDLQMIDVQPAYKNRFEYEGSDDLHEIDLTIEDKFNASEVKVEPRPICCCFKSRLNCLLVCLLLPVFVLSLAAATVWVLFPGIPKFELGSFYVPRNSKGLLYNSTQGSVLDTLSYDTAVNFTVTSTSNQIQRMSSLKKGNLLYDDGTIVENAFGIGILNDTVFTKQSTSEHTMRLRLYYRNPGNITEDKALALLSNVISSQPLGMIRIGYSVQVSLSLISWTGAKIAFSSILDYDLNSLNFNQQQTVVEMIKTFIRGIVDSSKPQ